MNQKRLDQDIKNYHEMAPYQLGKVAKETMFLESMKLLTSYHSANCSQYQNMLNTLGVTSEALSSISDVPFLPVSLFKSLSLKSIPEADVFKTMTSSGTTGQAVSKIYLDKSTVASQQKALTKIVSSYTGGSRMPMLIIDSPSVLKNRKMFSARGAGILGFSIFGSKRAYALDDEMNLNVDQIMEFVEKHQDRTIFLFGFTFMVWKHFYQKLKEYNQVNERKIDLSNAVLIHGGGWKKLQNESVTPEEFGKALNRVCSIPEEQIHDYYGMVEQTGSIYMQCSHGHLHVSHYSDVIIRRAADFSICDIGERGIIQVLSVLPHSYPGHSLLTEDEGVLLGEDNCPCGRKGKYFKIFGRLKNAEIRGCSDTYATQF
ncbi:acyl-protein synthetase [Vibrio tapetis subsp. quintayensis]|uniref:LuxE/PaaK family acyltransferase n=1 Tax=Vibrio tapetis TaxID=52443 RepID=UPI0025B5EEFF|nr:acyl-protein synthetase [Vibrio tapetis]MDN3679457.1 acyl-protein synthetase [Vibrio tapetis subsp. quintayensis]